MKADSDTTVDGVGQNGDKGIAILFMQWQSLNDCCDVLKTESTYYIHLNLISCTQHKIHRRVNGVTV